MEGSAESDRARSQTGVAGPVRLGWSKCGNISRETGN